MIISRQDALNALEWTWAGKTANDAIKNLPSAQPDIIRCKDCIYGYLYVDIQNGVTDSWIECRNPEGLNRDVSVNGYCSESIRREEDDERTY